MPDAGRLSYGEMAAQLQRTSAPRRPRSPLHRRDRRHRLRQRPERPRRTVRGFAAAGAACPMLEDRGGAWKRDIGAPGSGGPVAGRRAAPREAAVRPQGRRGHPDHRADRRRNAAGPASGPRRGALARLCLAFAGLALSTRRSSPARIDERELERVREAALEAPARPGGRAWSGAPTGRCVHALGFSGGALYGITLVLSRVPPPSATRSPRWAAGRGRCRRSGVATSGEIGDIVGAVITWRRARSEGG